MMSIVQGNSSLIEDANKKLDFLEDFAQRKIKALYLEDYEGNQIESPKKDFREKIPLIKCDPARVEGYVELEIESPEYNYKTINLELNER